MPAALGVLGGVFSFGASAAFAAGGAAFGGWVAGAGFASTILGSITVKLLTTVAFTALSQALASEPAQGGGLTVPATVRGEDNPETIILGRYATGGQAICPPYTHGKDGRYMTQVIELCSASGATLERFMLGDEWRELTDDWVPRSDQNKAGFGKLVRGQRENLTWVKYYDGTQTAADPFLLEKYGNHADRPWTADMVGRGVCYAILTFRHDREHQTTVPRYRFEMGGIPLYDIRRDSTAGGVGPQRLDDPSTWVPSHNPIVQSWNLMRGIPLPGGEVYGGDIRDLSALPRASWVNGMNRSDLRVEVDGGTEPAYRAGLEISLAQPPAAALEELFKAASATVADQGYAWTVTVGAPELPVYTFSDDDVIVSQTQELDPFPGLEQTYNAVTGRYPEPAELWETKEAPQRTNAEWEASDAFGRRSATLSLPAVPFYVQGGTVYMDKAVIKHGDIDTLQLADGAATMAWSAEAASLTIVASYPMRLMIMTNCRIMGTNSTHTTTYRITRNGSSAAATYVWRESTSTWIKISEAESMDLSLSWSTLSGRPSSTPANIDAAVTARHTHANATQLNQIGEDGDQNLTYRGQRPGVAWNSTGW